MSITLLTAVPGGGKTAYAVWYEIKKAHQEGRVIYTCGIPELKIPTIELSYDDVRKWYLRDETGKLPVLQNIAQGALIVVDEVQKLWPASGSKITQDINDLSEHRHFGLSFFLITQSPTLVHRKVLAVVERHLHIRAPWSGRKLYEWPEYCSNPTAKTNRNQAVVTSYKIPEQSFALYHSSSEHIKPVKRVPFGFYFFILTLIVVPYLLYSAYDMIINKSAVQEEIHLEENYLMSETPQPVIPQEVQPFTVEHVILSPQLPTLLSNQFDWENIGACVSSVDSCVCYGVQANRLVIPLETCRLAVKHGWSRRSPPSSTRVSSS